MVISALLIGSILDKIGHKVVITFGAFLMAVSIACFGFIERFDEQAYVISLAIVLRLGQGAASGMINTAAYSFASTAYPDTIDKVISIMEAVVGVGCTSGPILGSFVYTAVGFAKTFFIFGGCLLPVAVLICIFLPKPKDVKKVKDSLLQVSQVENDDDDRTAN